MDSRRYPDGSFGRGGDALVAPATISLPWTGVGIVPARQADIDKREGSTMPLFGRVATAMATPFLADESLDVAGAARLARHLVDHGTDTLVLNGTTGESPSLTTDEVARLVAAVRDEVGDTARVMVGTGTNSTRSSAARTAEAGDLGADSVLVVMPYYNRPDPAGQIRHFTEVAAATDLPVLLYDVPHRTGREIDLQALVELSRVDNIVGVKDAASNLGKTADLLHLTDGAVPGGFEVYCGADELNLPMLAVGASGLVSVSAHLVGAQLAQMCDAVEAGDLATAREIHLRCMAIHRALFREASPGPLKAGLALLDLPAGPVRGPLTSASPQATMAVALAMVHAGVLADDAFDAVTAHLRDVRNDLEADRDDLQLPET
ncbi:MAG TPA: 4-hydroxy-tetrahydrodipicolinate synthase [Nitriliruptoraceae bacterium]|nr:4-hydroxy-tetrahydrodipicolinate synthase [Nitriliruptoraceae bacterium]